MVPYLGAYTRASERTFTRALKEVTQAGITGCGRTNGATADTSALSPGHGAERTSAATRGWRFASLALALGLLLLVSAIPVLGWVIAVGALMAGSGALVRQRFRPVAAS